MRKNKLKEIWAEGRPVMHGWLSISNPFVAEIMAEAGYDAISLDLQHGVHDYMGAVTMFQAMRASNVMPMARVPWLDPGWIMKVLDAGAYGVICPMIDNAEQAAKLASYCRYPPRGLRSFGPTRAVYPMGPGYAEEANDEILVFAMIETAEGVKNAREICETPGIDGIYIGPADLTLGMTNGRLPAGFDREEEEMIAVIKDLLATAKAAGIHACMHCISSDYAARAVGWGFDMVTLASDARILAGGAAASIGRFKELTGAVEAKKGPEGY